MGSYAVQNGSTKPKKKFTLRAQGVEVDYLFDREAAYSIKGADTSLSITEFSELGLHPRILENMRKAGIMRPTPIQRHGMPQVNAGKDVMCCSHTGSGKTAAYMVPIINLIISDRQRYGDDGGKVSAETTGKKGRIISAPVALVLVPTRELACQVSQDAKMFAGKIDISSLAIYGGDNIGNELRNLRMKRPEILVATPGRLLHFLEEDLVSVEKIEYLILDEADEMLDRGFYPQIRDIISNYNMKPKEKRINVMFSATYPNEIQYIAKNYLRINYVFIVIGILGGASPDISQQVQCVSQSEKKFTLFQIIEKLEDDEKLLVFCNTIERANEISSYLRSKDLNPAVIHSEFTQNERIEALREFDCGKSKILIATSVAARGLNIQGLRRILNYDLPQDVDEYVQRVGRTGRLGEVGVALSFYDEDADRDLAEALRIVLTCSNQDVPEFLVNVCNDVNGLTETEDYLQASEDLKGKMKKCRIDGTYEFVGEEAWGF